MNNEIQRGSIVVGVDGSAPSEHALRQAIDLASLEHRPLHVLHAFDPVPWRPDPTEFVPQTDEVTVALDHRAAELLKRALDAAARAAPTLEISGSRTRRDAREALRSASETAQAVVVGARGLGPMRSLLLGSVSLWVSQHAHCPVLVVRPPTDRGRIIVGTDGGPVSTEALEFAFAQASLRAVPLTIIHCFTDFLIVGNRGAVEVRDPDISQLSVEGLTIGESVAELREKFVDVDVTLELGQGPAGPYLARASERADLLVVGSRHRSLAGGMLFGSVSRSVSEHARCTVAVVPSRAASWAPRV